MLNPAIPDSGNWRFEYKYQLSRSAYYQMRAAIRPFMRLDHFTRLSSNNRYLVRSLYYDTSDYRAYQEKVNGDCDRTKLRIRSYSTIPQDVPGIRIEMKARKGISMEKHSIFVPPAAYDHFISCKRWQSESDPLLIEFERYVRLKNLAPQVIVEYLREGYSAIDQDNLRVTFDHQVRSASAKTLFPSHPAFRSHNRGMVILEIKCNKSQPDWLHRLIFTQGLRITANSKFAQAIQLSRPDIIAPAWSY